MVSSGMLRLAALVRTDVTEERSATFIRLTRIGELGTTLAVTNNRRTLSQSRNIVYLRSVRRLLDRANFPKFIDSCHPDYGGAKFHRNVGSYKSHTA
jgi:hypothetical protein